METRKVDVAIIGAGTAGLNARRAALKQGASVVMIEDGPYGTTCARVGCMPSKLLIAAADAAHEIRHADIFGVHAAGGVELDQSELLGRVRRERDRFAGFVVSDVEEMPAEQKLRGTARFTGRTTLEVSDTETGEKTLVEAGAVVLATGSQTWYPAFFEKAGDKLLRNDDVFELERLPESMAVIGAGVIGLELGQALHRLGVRVSFFSLLPLLGPLTDPAIQAKARDVLGRELDLELPVRITDIEPDGDGVLLRWEDPDGAGHEARFATILAATGRRPRLAGLNLEAAGIVLQENGVPVFDPTTMQCGDSPIFIAGDATGDRPVLHEASDEGRIAGANAARFPHVEPGSRRTQLAVVFIDLGMAMAGMSYRELEESDIDFVIGEVSYDNQGRSRVMGRNAGLVRIYGERGTGRLLGAELFGPRVEHTSHLLAWAIQAGLTVREALQMPFYHPVIEEGIRTGLRSLAKAVEAA